MKKVIRFIPAWSAREMALIEHVQLNFLPGKDDADGIEYSFWCIGPFDAASPMLESIKDESHKSESLTPRTRASTAGRMDIGAVIRSAAEGGHETSVLVCGPGSMADETTGQVVNCVKDGLRVALIEEAFAW
jgi:hypothetical protein